MGVIDLQVDLTGISTIKIPYSQYLRLLDDSDKLSALEDAGVDNWQWYDDAMELYNSRKEPE